MLCVPPTPVVVQRFSVVLLFPIVMKFAPAVVAFAPILQVEVCDVPLQIFNVPE
jgi:hypothetical protein